MIQWQILLGYCYLNINPKCTIHSIICVLSRLKFSYRIIFKRKKKKKGRRRNQSIGMSYWLVSVENAKSPMQCWTSSQGTSSILVKYLRACFTASILRSDLIISTNSCWRKRNSRVDLIFRSLLLWSWIHASAACVCCWARLCSTLRATKKMSKFVSSPSSGFCSTIFWAVKVNDFNASIVLSWKLHQVCKLPVL